MNPILQSAMLYIALGIPVFPLWGSRPDGSCRCRFSVPREPCDNTGKHPLGCLVKHGLYSATLDIEVVRAWVNEYPFMNIGIRCGEEMKDGRFLVIADIDPRNGGDTTLSSLVYEPTRTTITHSLGQHLLFGSKLPIPKGSAGAGIDVQGRGSYCVGVNSTGKSGRTYQWDVGQPDEIADAPEWLGKGKRVRTAAAPKSEGDARDTWLGRAFEAAGWLGELGTDGKRFARCPWSEGHTIPTGRGADNASVIMPATGGARTGAFVCQHGKCRGRTLADVLRKLPQEAWNAGTGAYPLELEIVLRRAAA